MSFSVEGKLPMGITCKEVMDAQSRNGEDVPR